MPRQSKLKTLGPIRELTRDDMSLLHRTPPVTVSVTQLRDSHHRVARLAAAGMRQMDISARTGYSQNRLSAILASPAMQDLVATYRAKVDEKWADVLDVIEDDAVAAMQIGGRLIREKLETLDEDGGAALSLNDVSRIAQITADRMDRFGYGKKQTNINVNTDFAAELERAIARSGKTIEITSDEPSRRKA